MTKKIKKESHLTALVVVILLVVTVASVAAQSFTYPLPDGRVIVGTVNPNGTVTYSVDGDSITVDPTDPNYVSELEAWVNRIFGIGLQAETITESRTYHEQVTGNYRNITRSVGTFLSQSRAAARQSQSEDDGADDADETEARPVNSFLNLDTRFESFADDSDTDGEGSGITNFGYTWTFAPKTSGGTKHSRFFGFDIGVSGVRDDVPTDIQTTTVGVKWGRINMNGIVPGSVATSAVTYSNGYDKTADDTRTENVNLFYSFTMPLRFQGDDRGTVSIPVSYNAFIVYFTDGIGSMTTTTFDSPFAVDLFYPLAGGFELFWSNMLAVRWIEGTTVSSTQYGDGYGETLGFGAYTSDIGGRYRVTDRIGLTAALSIGAYPGSVTSIGFNAGVVY